jgi:ribosomal-protein-alanine N-acetyltransferase
MTQQTFLEGTTIFLRPLDKADVEGNYSKWMNDKYITQFNSHGIFPATKESLLNYISSLNDSAKSMVLAIVTKDKQFHIGNISLQEINWVNRSAELAFLLGEKEFWGKGIMYEAGMLIISHAFNALNLHRIYCGTSIENIGMRKLATKLGMQEEGIRKQAIYKNGRYLDIIEYGMVREL